MVVIIGIDVHKDTHTAVAIDEVGTKLGKARTVPASSAGHLDLIRWSTLIAAQQQAQQHTGERAVVFAVEDCRHVSVRLERDLLAAGAAVVRVAPRLSAAARTGVRTPGKSDPIDALAVARVALREGVATLPAATLEGETAQVKVLIDRREQLVGMRTGEINRLRTQLVVLAPEVERAEKDFTTGAAQQRLGQALRAGADQPAVGFSAVQWALRTQVAVDTVEHITALSASITAATAALGPLVARVAPGLLELAGCGVVCAARIIAETAGVAGFRSEAAYAMFAGIAPVPASSGRTQKMRLSRTGNRALNAAVHRISLTQARMPGPGREYLQRRLAAGDDTKTARRAHKRQLIRVIYQLLKAAVVPEQGPAAAPPTEPQPGLLAAA